MRLLSLVASMNTKEKRELLEQKLIEKFTPDQMILLTMAKKEVKEIASKYGSLGVIAVIMAGAELVPDE